MHDLSPKEIFKEYKDKLLNKDRASELLIYLINNNSSETIRTSSLKYLGMIGLKKDFIFTELENLLVSDSNQILRGIAAEIIIENFPVKAIQPIKWALTKIKSNYCLTTIVKALQRSKEPNLNAFINSLGFVIYNDSVIFPNAAILFLNQKNIFDIEQIIGLKSLEDITELYLQDNTIVDIKGLENLKNLEILSLHINNIKEIQGLNNLKNLKKLYLQVNLIERINNLDTLKNLEVLDLSFNKITEIEGLTRLKKLKKLFLSFNKIKEIKGLEHLSNIKELYLRNNIIENIQGLENLVNLEILDLSNNRIVSIEGLSNLRKLTNLSLSYNYLKEIHGLDKLVNLKRLELNFNNIYHIQGLEKLENLNILNLSNNRIRKIRGLENLINLTFLNLDNNEISEIEGLKTLKELEYLYLENNFVTEIKDLECLDNLKVVNLRNTDVTEIPFIIFSHQSLKELNCINCPISNVLDVKKQLQKSKNLGLRVMFYDSISSNYRQPIGKEITEISPIKFNLNFNDLTFMSELTNPIDFFSKFVFKITKYSRDVEIYELDKTGQIHLIQSSKEQS
ncbi:MAG: leucine-rich repeat domain-containing protein [Promethearchaeota archaeon]